MKKLFISMSMASLFVFGGCSVKTPAPTATTPANVTSAPATAQPVVTPSTPIATDGKTMTGQGHVLTLSKKSGDNKDFRVDEIWVAATFDDKGTIMDVRIDAGQVDVAYDEQGAMKTTLGEIPSKRDKGDAYGMKKASAIGKEWYEQADALQAWMTGKNVEDVLAMKTFEKDASHPKVPDVAELKTSVTIDVSDYLQALKRAYESAKQNNVSATPQGKIYTSTGHVQKLSKKAGDNKDYRFDAVFTAIAFDEKGTIVSVLFDNGQVDVAYDADGNMKTPLGEFQSKRDKGDAYGMKKASAIGKEWYEQANALQAWMIGKNVADVLGMKTFAKDENHPKVPDVAELKTSVSIDVSDYLEAVSRAYAAIK